MKKVIALGFVVSLCGMSSFGQETNSVPQKIQSSNSPAQTQKAAVRPRSAGESRELSRTNQLPQVTVARQNWRQRLFRPQKVDNYDAEMNQIFFPGSDQVADTMARNTIITIYPPGH